jgi:hypothetical protein
VSRQAARYRQRQLDHEAAERVREAVDAAEALEEAKPNPRSLPGDPPRVRGLPAFRSGASAAIAGSDPLRAVLAKEERQERRRR